MLISLAGLVGPDGNTLLIVKLACINLRLKFSGLGPVYLCHSETVVIKRLSFCFKLYLLAGKIVLSGDPHQLGPVVQDRLADKLGLGLSPLERLMKNNSLYKRDKNGNLNPDVITMLCKNFR